MTQIDLLEWDGNLLQLASIIRKPVKGYLAIALSVCVSIVGSYPAAVRDQ